MPRYNSAIVQVDLRTTEHGGGYRISIHRNGTVKADDHYILLLAMHAIGTELDRHWAEEGCANDEPKVTEKTREVITQSLQRHALSNGLTPGGTIKDGSSKDTTHDDTNSR